MDMRLDERKLAAYFDHTQLAASATRADFERLAKECRENGFAMAAINSCRVKLVRELLSGSGTRTGAAVGFPLGQTSLAAKLFEIRDAIESGAEEIDYVINIGALKDGDDAYILREMREIVTVCRDSGVLSKVIFETCYLTDEEIVRLCGIAREARPDFVKTSTGFGTGGATAAHVRLMKENVGEGIAVKASGGIRDLKTCMAMIDAGATRIGSSRSVEILAEFRKAKGGPA